MDGPFVFLSPLSHLFNVKVLIKDKKFALIEWQRIKPATDWHELSDGFATSCEPM